MTATAMHMTPATQTLEFGGSSMAPLDAAAEYLRSNVDRVLPLYALAMGPHAAVSLMLIEAIAAKHGGQLRPLCMARSHPPCGGGSGWQIFNPACRPI